MDLRQNRVTSAREPEDELKRVAQRRGSGAAQGVHGGVPQPGEEVSGTNSRIQRRGAHQLWLQNTIVMSTGIYIF